MTTVDKLLIKGIRSFSPDNQIVIEFFKPLTVIVGQNGAGKTTIIECLKYATTGDFPPGTRSGQAFVHDPKVAAEREVKGQIKLRFTGLNGQLFVCTRSLQLSQKQQKQELKTLESALQTYNASGQRVSQSYRCADLDKEIPELMGVSKAILENVIFCHQEDSNWPLEDSSSLKKRFDDIFAATRYTKALEAIKKQKKEYSVKLKEHKLNLKNLKTVHDDAMNTRKEIEENQRGEESILEEIGGVQKEIRDRETKIMELKKKQKEYSSQLEEIKRLTIQLEFQRSELDKFQHDLEFSEFTETTEELRDMKLKLETQLHSLYDKEKDWKLELQKKEAEIKLSEKQIQEINEGVASKTSLLRNQSAIERDLQRGVEAFTSSNGIGFSSHRDFFEKATKLGAEKESEILNAKASIKGRMSDISNKIARLNSESGSISERCRSQQENIRKNREKISLIEKNVIQVRQTSSKLSEYEAQLAEQKQKLSQLSESNTVNQIITQIDLTIEKRNRSQERFDQLSSVIKGLNAQQSVLNRIALLKEQYEQKKRQLSEIVLQSLSRHLSEMLITLQDTMSSVNP